LVILLHLKYVDLLMPVSCEAAVDIWNRVDILVYLVTYFSLSNKYIGCKALLVCRSIGANAVPVDRPVGS
jgi:hypothetical protein